MKYKLLVSIFLLAMMPDQKQLLTEGSSQHFIIHQLNEGVWAAINKEEPGSHAICNAGIIDLGDKTVVIDPFMNIDAAEDLKNIAEILTGRIPSYVINSHFHNDHIRGNQVFLPATIVSTEWTKTQIAISEPEELQWEKENASNILEGYKKSASTAKGLDKKELPLWINYFEGMVKNNAIIKTTLPNLTFQDSLWIKGEKRNLKLMEYRDAHTHSDLTVYLPSDQIFFAGDMYFNKAHAWLSDGNPDSLKKYLRQIVNDDHIKKIVPGHGLLGEKEEVNHEIRYINDLEQMVKTQKGKGTPDTVILQMPIPKPYEDWTFGSRFYKANLQFFCKKFSK